MEIIGFILMAMGCIVAIVGGIWFLLVAFNESILWGLACLFLAPASLIFLIMHWDEAGKPFLLQLAGVIPVIAGMMMMGGSA